MFDYICFICDVLWMCLNIIDMHLSHPLNHRNVRSTQNELTTGNSFTFFYVSLLLFDIWFSITIYPTKMRNGNIFDFYSLTGIGSIFFLQNDAFFSFSINGANICYLFKMEMWCFTLYMYHHPHNLLSIRIWYEYYSKSIGKYVNNLNNIFTIQRWKNIEDALLDIRHE